MDLTKSQTYRNFIADQHLEQKTLYPSLSTWTYFDLGPRSIKSPILFLPPCAGTAEIFYQQLVFLSSKGYRVISINYPVVWTVAEFNDLFSKFIDSLGLSCIHIIGASLGGFLAQKFAQSTPQKIASIILVNSFMDTSGFSSNVESKTFWIMPKYILCQTLKNNCVTQSKDHDIIAASNYVQQKLDSLTQSELASRMTLNSGLERVATGNLQQKPITIVTVEDSCGMPWGMRETLLKYYRSATHYSMKQGGNFPFLSRSSEFNEYIQLHFNPFLNSDECPTVDMTGVDEGALARALDAPFNQKNNTSLLPTIC